MTIQFIVRHAELRWCERIVQLGFSYNKNVIFDKQWENIIEFISHTIDIVMSDKHVFGVVPFEAMDIKAIWIWIWHYRLITDINLAFVITDLVGALRRVMSDIFMATWWRHQMETFTASLAICAKNSPITGEFPSHRPVTRSFGVFFDLCPNKRLSKQS